MGLRLVGRLMVRVSALTAPSVGITDGRQVPTQRWLLFGGRSLMTFSSSPVPLENLESYERMEVIFPFIILVVFRVKSSRGMLVRLLQRNVSVTFEKFFPRDCSRSHIAE